MAGPIVNADIETVTATTVAASSGRFSELRI